MKKLNRFLSYALTAMLASALTLGVVMSQVDLRPSKLEQLEALIQQRFIAQWDTTQMEDAAADAMVKSLGDRWSYYIPASEYAAYQERANNAYVGVGITIIQEENAGLRILTVQEGGSAEEAGLLPGDLIVGIEGNSTLDMAASAARELVRGKEGTLVEFSIVRDGEELTVSVPRRRIQTPVAVAKMLNDHVGLITIANFDSRCAEESIREIRELQEQGADALIFDVRNNPGGYAHELVKLLDYLLPEGDLFRAVDYQGKENVDTSDAAFLDLPMAVLCNGDSYSAAEFFAAALQEYEAATVVGEQTCGKGYFQNTFELQDGSAVGLSVGKYFTPKGNSLIGVGIQPDIPVPVDEETQKAITYGTLEPLADPQILAALAALEAQK